MKCALLLGLFSMVAARFSSAVDGVHMNSHREMRALWQAKGEFLDTLATTRFFHTLDNAQACQASFQNFQMKADTCTSRVGMIFAPNSPDNSSEVHSAIDEYCTAGGCDSQMKTAALAIKTDCIDSGVLGDMCGAHTDQTSCTENSTVCAWDAGKCHVNGDFFGTLKMILSVFCIQNSPPAGTPAKFCVPSFFDFANTKANGITAMQQQLTNGCDECTLKIFQVWSRVEPLKAAVHFIQLSNVCLKRAGEFCVIHQLTLDAGRALQGAECNTYTDTNSCGSAARGCTWNGKGCEETWTDTKLTPLCHPCTLVYAFRTLFLNNLMDQFGLPDPDNARRNLTIGLSTIAYVVNGVCSTDLQDKFCMPQMQNQNTDFSCAGMTTFFKKVGCCAPSIITFSQGLCNIDKAMNPSSTCQADLDALETQIHSCSGLDLGKPCAQLKYMLVHEAILSGIAADWLAANKDRLITELKKVIAFAIGIDIAFITDLKIVAALSGGRRLLAGDLQVTTTISMPQYSAQQSATEGLQGQLDPLGINDAVQSTTPGGSLAEVTFTGQTVTNVATPPGASSASTAAPLLGVILAGLLLL